MSSPPATSGFPRLLVVTDNDHSAWIVIATALGLACVLIFAAARTVVRYSTTSDFGLDDTVYVCSVALTIIQSSVVLYGCSLGLGASMAHMTPERQTKVQKVYYGGILLWILALGLSKISVATLITRINGDRQRNMVFRVTTAVLGVWILASFFMLALQCNLSHPWITLHEKCSNADLRWKLINAFDIATEPLLIALIVFLVWPLQTSWMKKAKVVAGFACRLPIIITIGFRLGTFSQSGLTTNPSLKEALFVVWTQTELNYSLISAAIPSLLQFMRNLNTHFGGITEAENATYGSTQKTSGRSFPMSVLRSGNKSNNGSHNRSALREAESMNNTSVAYAIPMAKPAGLKTKGSMGSNDSRRNIITKDMTYSVEYE